MPCCGSSAANTGSPRATRLPASSAAYEAAERFGCPQFVAGDLGDDGFPVTDGHQERAGHEEGQAAFLEDEGRAAALAAGEDPDQPKYNGVVLMAAVKEDVRDIGKNIVRIVMGCNNFKVIDMGVMVPCENILEKAVEGRCVHSKIPVESGCHWTFRAHHTLLGRDG
ncbi:metr-1 [Symbiodinium sp. CCMP2592]|nr:metr-1 [Symbiodinium sp. CCMP2592]